MAMFLSHWVLHHKGIKRYNTSNLNVKHRFTTKVLEKKKTALVSIAQNTVRDLALDDGEYMTDAAPGNAITSCLNLPIKLER